MKIVGGTVIVCSPGRNFVTLKLETEDGIYGLGDATLNGRELAVASYLTDHVIPLLVGRDARRIEDIWQFLYKGAYWRRGPVTMTAIAAVDTALWDLKGKALTRPCISFLAGPLATPSWCTGTPAATRSRRPSTPSRATWHAATRPCVRRQACPGSRARTVSHAATRMSLPSVGSRRRREWSSERYLECVPPLFERLRSEFGTNLHLLHDVHHRLTPIEAGRLGKALEPHRLFWLEDPTPAENQEAFRLIRQHTTTPLAVGEVFNSIHDCRQLIQEQLIDYIRTTVVHAGGISHLRKIASLAELYQIRTGSHGATDLSPVCMAAALHFDLSVHNFGIQEYMPHTVETDRVFPHAYSFGDGAMHPGDAPGLGVDIDETLAATFPYQRAYLPIARLIDGTMHNW